MKNLAYEHCVPINSTSIKLTGPEIKPLEASLSGWTIRKIGDELRLEKSFKFKDFNQAMAFANQVAQAADQEDHHPAILTEWGKVTLGWWTHTVKGLHLNDFIMAAKSDHLYEIEVLNKTE